MAPADADAALEAVPDAEALVVPVASADWEPVKVAAEVSEAEREAPADCVAVSRADALGEPDALAQGVDVLDTRMLPLTDTDAEIVARALAVAEGVKVATVRVAVCVGTAEKVTVATEEELEEGAVVLEAQGLGVAVSVAPPVVEAVVDADAVSVSCAEPVGAKVAEALTVAECATVGEGVVEGVLEGVRSTVDETEPLGETLGAATVGVCGADLVPAKNAEPVTVGYTVKDTDGRVDVVSEGSVVLLGVPTPTDAVGEGELLGHALTEAPAREGVDSRLPVGLSERLSEGVEEPEKEALTECDGEGEAVPASTVTLALMDAECVTEALPVVLALSHALGLPEKVGGTESEGEDEADPESEPPPLLGVPVFDWLAVREPPAREALGVGPPRQLEGELVVEEEALKLRVSPTLPERVAARDGELLTERLSVTDTVGVAVSVSPEELAEAEGQGDPVSLREGEDEALLQADSDDEAAADSDGESTPDAEPEGLSEEEELPLTEGEWEGDGVAEPERLALTHALPELLGVRDPPHPEEALDETLGVLLPVAAPLRDAENEPETQAVADRVRVAHAEEDPEKEGLPEGLGDWDLLGVPQLDTVPPTRTVGVTEVHMVRDCEGEPLVVALREPDLHAEGEAVPDTERESLRVSAEHAVAVTDRVAPVAVLLREGVELPDGLGEGDWLWEPEGDAEDEPEPVSEREPLPLTERLPVGVMLALTDSERVELCEGELVTDADAE